MKLIFSSQDKEIFSFLMRVFFVTILAMNVAITVTILNGQSILLLKTIPSFVQVLLAIISIIVFLRVGFSLIL